MIIGVDTKAAARYQKVFFAVVKKETPFRLLNRSFGDAMPLTTEAIQKGYLDIILDSVWDDNHRFGDKEFKWALQDARKLARIVKDNYVENQQVYFCPYLEHRINSKTVLRRQFRQLLDILEPVGIWLVNNPLRQGTLVSMPGVINCVHHEDRPYGNPKGAEGWYIYSEDGKDSTNRNIQLKQNKERRNGCAMWLSWTPQMNLVTAKQNNTGSAPKRPKRPSSVMNQELLESYVYWECKRKKVKLDKKHIWKSHAEQHNAPAESRANKPVFITQQRFNSVHITNMNGKGKRKLTSSGRLHDGRYVWRLNEYGYQRAEKYEKRTGDPRCQIFGDNRKIGVGNTAYRTGDYK